MIDPNAQSFFDAQDAAKQERYSHRIAREIAKGLGITGVRLSSLELQAKADCKSFDPHWLSDRLMSPVMFRAVKDYDTEKLFPGPDWLMTHKTMGPAFERQWSNIWTETKERYEGYKVAACFRPEWASRTLAVHNYDVARYAGSSRFFMAKYTDEGLIFIQSLKDLLASILSQGWLPPANVTS